MLKRSIVIAVGLLAAIAAGPTLAAAYTAGGTHQCKSAEGGVHSCVVTISNASDCVSASQSLRARDCCPSTRDCARDAQGRQTNCQRGGSSVGFTINYCIPGR